MIIVDTNVLVALADEQDRLHRTAKRDLKRLRAKELAVTSAVLAECLFLLPAPYLRRRVAFLLEQLAVVAIELSPPWWSEVFEWLDRYAEHEPDLADAQLAALSSRDAAHRVWTYDGEFQSIWRRSDGSRIPLAASARAGR